MSSDDGKSSVELSKKTVGELKRLRGTLKSRITLLQKFVVKIDSDSLTPLQITELEIRLQSAKDTFNEFNNIQNKIELLVEESELDEHLEYRDIFESLYYSVSAVVQQLIKPVKDSESSGYGNFTDEDSGNENDASFLHLPSRMLRLEIETQVRPTDTNNEKEVIEERQLENKELARKKNKEFTVKNGQIIYHFLHLVK
ncbi:hypothetical protein ACJJTC_009357 [Scirpophaga incertulas]